ncbi:MAG TPA: hypothetical protein VKF38_14875 [Anaerolineaceae bacterium]|nr:hypothetical protein [Anaerolineaceae bacterium]
MKKPLLSWVMGRRGLLCHWVTGKEDVRSDIKGKSDTGKSK